MKSKFQRGSGCFTCKSCGKMTRDTDDNGSWCRVCPLCYEKGSWGNHLSDNGIGDWADLESCATVEEVMKKVHELEAKAGLVWEGGCLVKKGGAQ